MNVLNAILDRIINYLAFLAGAFLCGLTLLICLDVFVRNFKLFSMGWTLDITEYLLYLITFFGTPWVLREGGHISVDLLIQTLSERMVRRVLWGANLVGAIICAILLYYSVFVLRTSYESGTQIYESLVFPEWYIFVPAPITMFLLLMIFVSWLIRPALQFEQQTTSEGL